MRISSLVGLTSLVLNSCVALLWSQGMGNLNVHYNLRLSYVFTYIGIRLVDTYSSQLFSAGMFYSCIWPASKLIEGRHHSA